MKLTTSAQMRELDRIAIEERKIPSIDLMERAAEGVAAAAMELLPDAIYAEVSTSGHGLHVFVWSSEASFRRAGVEFYSHSRFIRMTGRRWPK